MTRRIVGTDTTTYEYNDAGRLVSINGVATASYAYDGMHRRVKKTIGENGRKYIPAPNGYLLSEYDLTNGWLGDYVYLNGRPLAKITANSIDSVLYYVNDHLGTPVALVDNNRLKRWSAKWYPFGDIYDEQVSATNQIRFPGQWRDDESDLSYNWNRYYSPEEGRYYQADPLGLEGGDNLYRYALANPLRFIDPTGLKCRRSYWQRVSDNFLETNRAIPGLLHPRGLGILTSRQIVSLTGGTTLWRWISGGLRGLTMNGVTFTGVETGIIASGVSILNWALVGVAFETGVGLGSLISAAVFPCDDAPEQVQKQRCK